MSCSLPPQVTRETDCVTLRRYRMVTRAKPVNWPGVRWAAVDDARLLVGVMEHGIGNWDSIRDDPHLNMGNKVGTTMTDYCRQRHCAPHIIITDPLSREVSQATGVPPAEACGVPAEADGDRGQDSQQEGQQRVTLCVDN